MNIKSYLFRSMIAGIAFLLGISAQRNLWELDRSCRQWLNTAAAVLPFQSAYENLFGAKASAASGDLTGEYYLSEEVVPGGFTDFARIEFYNAQLRSRRSYSAYWSNLCRSGVQVY
ncbi:MAG: hypothetical protein IPL32_02800 [Chloracidobacterium sp.]|nr:hypothetical protein [Chloracidobacterium sp.]